MKVLTIAMTRLWVFESWYLPKKKILIIIKILKKVKNSSMFLEPRNRMLSYELKEALALLC